MSGCGGKSSDPSGTGRTNSASEDCKQCTITSQTTATVPANRARTKIGVGEEVTLTVSPGPATWTVNRGGAVTPKSGTTVTFRAGGRAAKATVTAAGSGGSCTIAFTIVEPSSLTMARAAGTGIRHTQNQPDSGFLGQPYVHPDDVSFHNIEVREKNSRAKASGYFKPFDKITHQPAGQKHSAWLTVKQCEAGSGSPANCRDQIYSGYTNKPVAEGLMTFPIEWEYRVGAGAAKRIGRAFEQRHQVTATGRSTTSKGGTSVTTNLADPTSSW